MHNTYLFVFHNYEFELYVKRIALILFNITKKTCYNHLQTVLEKQYIFVNKNKFGGERLQNYASNISQHIYRLKALHFTEFVYSTQNSRKQNMIEHIL